MTIIKAIKPIKRVLIANRGEIAVRIIRACRELDILPIAVYSEADAGALHVRMASASVAIGGAPPKESYLNSDRIIEAALKTKCDALHPGYGFLSENADFAQAVQAAGLTFIGPAAAAIRAMGVKTEALALMRAAGVPTVPGYAGGNAESDYVQAAQHIGYPVLIKAAAGGGGKGMRVVRAESDLRDSLAAAQREAVNAFGDAAVFLEKYIEGARHIEFQVFGDQHGALVHLFERDCSIQRRHQKIIEESPSPLLDPDLRARMGQAAIAAARAVDYVNAGTVEFIVDATHNFYFLEMNTRLQVEHPVTEWVTGLDLVKLQFRVAMGEALPFTQADVTQRGHAIECRIYAEDPANDFMPSIGTLDTVIAPSGPGIRVDSGIESGDAVTIYYDPMIAKLSVYGTDREDARARMRQTLAAYQLRGVTTNRDFLRAVIDHPAFARGEATTSFIAQYMADWQAPAESQSNDQAPLMRETPATLNAVADPWARADGFRIGGGVTYAIGTRQGGSTRRDARQTENALMAAMPGQVMGVLVAEGEAVTRGQTLILLEAMKMEIRISAPHDGHLAKVHCAVGQIVTRGQTLIELRAE